MKITPFLEQKINAYAKTNEITPLNGFDDLDSYFEFLLRPYHPFKYRQFYFLIRKWLYEDKQTRPFVFE